MSVPTVNVTIQVNDSLGNPVEGARVSAKLSTTEKYNGFVAPQVANGISDATGVTVLALFPNELGSENSEYAFKILLPTGKSIKLDAVVPNMDCNLFEIANIPPFPRSYVGETFNASVIEAKDQAEVAKAAAATSEANALASENNASQFSADAQQSKSDALSSSVSASTSAGQAETSKIAAESARDAAQAAKVGAESARDGAVVAKGEAESLAASIPAIIDTEKSTAVTEITAAESSALTYIESAKGEAVGFIADMAGYSPDIQRVLDAEANRDITGVVQGTAGKMKTVRIGEITPDTVTVVSWPVGDCVILQNHSVGGRIKSYGLYDRLSSSVCGKLFNGSGAVYDLFLIQIGETGTQTLAILPEHGTSIVSDFATDGTRYSYTVEQESTDPADQQEGDLDVIEYLLPKKNFTVAELHGVFADQYNNIAPDPTFEQDGMAGGWSSSGPTPLNGSVSFSGVAQWGAVFAAHSIAVTEGSKWLLKLVIESGTTGVLRGYWSPNDTDGSAEENFHDFIVSAGTHYAIIEADADSTTLGLQVASASTDAAVSELSFLEIPDSAYGTLNTGFFDEGNKKISQSLGNLQYWASDLDAVGIKHGSKITVRGYTYGRSASGNLVRYGSSWPTTELTLAPANAENVTIANIADSYSALGYTSKDELISKGGFKLEYKTRARSLRPATNPNEVLSVGDVYYTNEHYSQHGNILAGNLTGNVHTGTTLPTSLLSKVISYNKASENNKFGLWDTDIIHNIGVLSHSSSKRALKCISGTVNVGGIIHQYVWFKELVWDEAAGNWGDDGRFQIKDNVVTVLDLNGHAVLCGCMSRTTGIPVGGV
ncbi:hypothetical protein [Maridesulfovibrio ferrireducens]|uniref:hypothetical protein n=1 Tax=Maridesulfovibrio ferrireducens TaxID=246191 RepID=UPI001A243199|nr:hypothetical protein [Maridesulfovibrio ferrireducens]MBI9113172.1 hypothetical protein [Maridesulfovibrio ferrireducens]